MTLAPGTKLGPYEILAPIGAGGMGEVYRARDPRVGRDVAIKVSSEQFTDRFTREVHAVAALNHSNVCTLYDVGPNYLVMELIEGPTLADRIRQGAIPLEESLEIARQVADALEAAHEKGIVHRDLKPGNIKIRPDGAVKVLDFGLAKVEEAATVSLETSPTLSVAQTGAGVLLGTAAYMSPEQARGKAVDKRADIWAFGVVLYEMLTGRKLFSGETVSDTLAAVLKEEPDWDKVPAKVQPLLRSCLGKNPSHRLRDIGDAWRLMENVPEPVPLKRRWLWLGWGLAAVFIVAFAAMSFMYFREKAPSPEELIRLQIAPAVNLTRGSTFALSPDGRKLAFSAIASDGVPSLWVRALDSLDARALPGTDALTPPFWSYDSRFIAFWNGAQLKKVGVSGGPAQTICDFKSFLIGGSWNRDGVIIFGSNTAGIGLMRVAESGGSASPLTIPDRSRQEIHHSYPTFLPDGGHFLYLRSSSIPENDGLYVGSVDAKPEEQDSRRLMAVRYQTTYVPSPDSGPGQLLFLREGTLMSQPFDERRLKLVGEPIAIAEKVGSFLDTGYFSASTNGVLVYRGSGGQMLQAAWRDRQGKLLGTVGEPGLYYGLGLSPEGTRAAIGWHSLSQTSAIMDIWLLNFSRGAPSRFTFGKGKNQFPVWSPDGGRIIFSSNRDGGVSNLYQKLASGAKEEELLLKSNENKTPTCFSSDGRFLLYTAEDPKTKGDLWILPLEGDHRPIPFVRTEFSEYDGRFSPDMRWVAYVSDESGSSEIYVRRFSKTSAVASEEASGKWQVSKGGGTGPRWRGDSKELYYFDANGKVWAVEVTADSVFQAAIIKPLFQAPILFVPGMFSTSLIWDVASNGNRFILAETVSERSPAPFTVVLNWTRLLKK